MKSNETLSHIEYVNIGYDGINCINDINQDAIDYNEEITAWFINNNATCEITLHHEQSKEYSCCLYYLEVLMPSRCAQTFKNYFV